MSDSDSNEDYYGPALPPQFQQNKASDNSSERTGPIIAPAVPKPQPPPAPTIGPALPPGFQLPPTEDDDEDEECPTGQPEPYIEPDDEEDEDDDHDVVGPLPPDHPLAEARAAAFASSTNYKGEEEDNPKKLQREEWMLIPPRNKPVTELGLGPRKFLQRAPEAPVKDDGEPMDSDEEFERQTRAEMDQKVIDEYDNKMEAMIKKSGKGKRGAESLLEIHQREMKKKAKQEKSEESKRKPFDRNTDLAVSGLSKQDSKKYVEKSRELVGRFHPGRQKFL